MIGAKISAFYSSNVGKLSFNSVEKAQTLIEKVHFYDESGVIYSLNRIDFKAEVLIPVAPESSFYLNYRF